MKLYYSPGACSMAPHIVANEAGISLELEKVDLRAKQASDGADYAAVNPKGRVPALLLDSGELLTEGPTISLFLAETRPDAALVAPNGTMERYRMSEMMGYLNSEVHRTYSPMFRPGLAADARQGLENDLKKSYSLIAKRLVDRPYLFGSQFSIVDAYLFTLTNWAGVVKLDLSAFPDVLAFQARVAERPAVRTTMVEEGLIPAAS
jgi:glutathione S-transferase